MPGAGGDGPVGDDDALRPRRPDGEAATGQPSSFSTRGRPPVEHGRGHAGDVAGGDEARAAGRAPARRRRRWRWSPPGWRPSAAATVPGQVVGAAGVAAAEGDGEAAGLVDADDGRVGGLVAAAAGRRCARRRRWRGTGRSRRPRPSAAGTTVAPPAPCDVLVRQAAGQGADRPSVTETRDDPHSSGPQATNTGFSAARRTPPSGSTAARDTPTCTRWPSRSAAAAARSRAAKVATTRPPGRQPGQHGVEHVEAAAADEGPVGVGQAGQDAPAPRPRPPRPARRARRRCARGPLGVAGRRR